jgi:glutamate-1-semialdehyde 2,1-aminomutase
LYGFIADIVTFSKVVEVWFVGAFAAREEIMNHLAPLGGLFTKPGDEVGITCRLLVYNNARELNDTTEIFDSLAKRLNIYIGG